MQRCDGLRPGKIYRVLGLYISEEVEGVVVVLVDRETYGNYNLDDQVTNIKRNEEIGSEGG